MIKRVGRTFTRKNIGELMARVCPSDADADLEIQRLLERLGGDPAKGESK